MTAAVSRRRGGSAPPRDRAAALPPPVPRCGAAPDLLRAHVPLSLLLDLADPSGPHSDELYASEHEPQDWIPARR